MSEAFTRVLKSVLMAVNAVKISGKFLGFVTNKPRSDELVYEGCF